MTMIGGSVVVTSCIVRLGVVSFDMKPSWIRVTGQV